MAQNEIPKEVVQQVNPKEDVAVDQVSPEDLQALQSQLASGDTLVLDGNNSAEWMRYDLDFADPLGKALVKELQNKSDAHLVVRVRGGGVGKLTFPKYGDIKAYKILDSNNQVTYHVYGKGSDIIHLMKSAVYVAPEMDSVQFQTVVYGNSSSGEPQALAQRFFVLQQEEAADTGGPSLMVLKNSGRAQLPDLPDDAVRHEDFSRPTFTTTDKLPYDELKAGSFGLTKDQNPDALDDEAVTKEDTAVTINVLANDVDPDGNGLRLIEIVTDPEHGTVKIVNNQAVYTPDKNYNGNDTFVYRLEDGDGDQAVAKVVVKVLPDNDAPGAKVDPIIITEEDTPITTDDNFKELFVDPDGDTVLIKSIAVDAEHGKVTVDSDGNLTFVPDANYFGTDKVVVVITDGKAEAFVTIDLLVDPVNDLPVAGDDKADTEEGAPITIDVLSNDSDPVEGSKVTLESIEDNPTNGTAVVKGGKVVYTPKGNFSGTDTFTYKIQDADGGTAEAKVTVTVKSVNDSPVAVDDNIVLLEDTRKAIDVLQNDTDPDNDKLTISKIVELPKHGAVEIKDGKVIYTPDKDYHGDDSFTYRVEDGKGGFDDAVVELKVNPANDAPEAVDDSAVVREDESVNIDVLLNDKDPDGDSLSIDRIESSPEHGKAITLDGKIVYTPDSNFSGNDTFEYRVSDGQGGFDVARVNVKVESQNDAPDAADDLVKTREDTDVNFNILINDKDADGDSIKIDQLLTKPQHGIIVSFDEITGEVVYNPDANFNGVDKFTYKIDDGHGGFDTATVNLHVGSVNDNPAADPDDIFING